MAGADQEHLFVAPIQKIWIMRCVDVPRDVSEALRSAAGEGVTHPPVHGSSGTGRSRPGNWPAARNRRWLQGPIPRGSHSEKIRSGATVAALEKVDADIWFADWERGKCTAGWQLHLRNLIAEC
jgi:hypothetical protein